MGVVAAMEHGSPAGQRDARDRPTDVIGDPSPRAGPAARLALLLCRFLARTVFGLRLELQGAEHLPRTPGGRPAGGWIAAAVPHRRWIDPFLLLLLLPVEPRIVLFADGRVLMRTRFRRLLFRLIGGVVPVWPRGGPRAFAAHIAAARRVLDAGAVFGIFPEAGPPSPPDRARPIQPGLGYLALRTDASVVPMIIAGTGVLYRRRRLVLRVLPPLSARQLADLPATEPMPPAGSRAERSAAHRVAVSFDALTAPLVAALHHELERGARSDRRRWIWLTHWLDWDADAADAAARARAAGMHR
jgi:1-acyl-sn-glycerol-3-phosphate acyltransferase